MSPRTLTRYSLVALAAACAVLVSVLAVNLVQPARGDPANDATELGFLTVINQYRASMSKGPLAIDPRLNNASYWLANDMATKDYVSHTDSLNRAMTKRLEDIISKPLPYLLWGENIAAGYSTQQTVFEGWKGSPGHNANMLGDFNAIGIARVCLANTSYECYWATNFAKVSGQIPTVPGTTPTNSVTPTASPTASPAPSVSPTPSLAATASPSASPISSPSASPTPVTTSAPAITRNGLSVLLQDLSQAGTQINIGTGEALGLKIGDFIVVNPGGPTEERFQVQGLDPVALDHPAQNRHDAGEQVVRINRGDTDCDQEVTPEDMVEVLERHADVGEDAACQPMGDANCDGQQNTLDAIWIILRAALIVSFKAANCGAVGGGLPADTQTTVAAPAGADILQILNADGFHVGDTIRINPGGANEEENVITAIGSFVLQSPLLFNHNAGEPVEKVLTVPPVVPGTPTPTGSPTSTPTATPTNTPTPSPTLQPCSPTEPPAETQTPAGTPCATPSATLPFCEEPSAGTPTGTPCATFPPETDTPTPTETPTASPTTTPTFPPCAQGLQPQGPTDSPTPSPTASPCVPGG